MQLAHHVGSAVPLARPGVLEEIMGNPGNSDVARGAKNFLWRKVFGHFNINPGMAIACTERVS